MGGETYNGAWERGEELTTARGGGGDPQGGMTSVIPKCKKKTLSSPRADKSEGEGGTGTNNQPTGL